MRRPERYTSIFVRSPRPVKLAVGSNAGAKRLDEAEYKPKRIERGKGIADYASRAILVVSTVFGIGVFSYLFVDSYYKEDGYRPDYGEAIAGKTDVWKVTDPYNANEQYIPVRKTLSLHDDDIAAWTKTGQTIQVTGVKGPTYPSRYGLGNDGEGNGEWYFTSNKMPAFSRQKDGSFVPRFDENGAQMEVSGFIAANFLRPPSEEELQKINSGQK
jgi:hypothetical protein